MQSNGEKPGRAIAKAMRQGNKVYSPYFLLMWRAGLSDKMGFYYVASKKVGGAVERNRAVRLLREAVRQLADDPISNKLTPGVYVFIARPELARQKLSSVLPVMRDVFTKVVNC